MAPCDDGRCQGRLEMEAVSVQHRGREVLDEPPEAEQEAGGRAHLGAESPGEVPGREANVAHTGGSAPLDAPRLARRDDEDVGFLGESPVGLESHPFGAPRGSREVVAEGQHAQGTGLAAHRVPPRDAGL